MTVIRAATTHILTIRSMEPGDLPRLLQIEKQTPAPRWAAHQFKVDLRCGDRISLVATIKNYVVGFAIARLASQISGAPGEVPAVPRAAGADAPLPPVQLTLLHMAVAGDWLRRGVASTLLKQFEPFLRQPNDFIEAAVPETNLAAQLLLRSAGYRAVRVLRGFYPDEDAYLMERRRG
jgi:ribosomal protein S18 acetylase RimI-like enzyme